ncbi:MAG: hypothetical protein HY432_00520 [Candidatus Liptonbacteria bacterium]|nr:hypothetical protein [Candidatus Liptonbacteria bacterium]
MKYKISISVLVALLAILVVATGGLGLYYWKTGAGGGKGGIAGRVFLGPICPVIKNPPEDECAAKPYKANLVLTTKDQAGVVKEFNSDANGRFSVDISPGEYAIRSAAAANILPYCSSEGTIKVIKDSYTEANVYCDTGIR